MGDVIAFVPQGLGVSAGQHDDQGATPGTPPQAGRSTLGPDVVAKMERVVSEMAVQRAEIDRFRRTMADLKGQMAALSDSFQAYGRALDAIPHRALRKQAEQLARTMDIDPADAAAIRRDIKPR